MAPRGRPRKNRAPELTPPPSEEHQGEHSVHGTGQAGSSNPARSDQERHSEASREDQPPPSPPMMEQFMTMLLAQQQSQQQYLQMLEQILTVSQLKTRTSASDEKADLPTLVKAVRGEKPKEYNGVGDSMILDSWIRSWEKIFTKLHVPPEYMIDLSSYYLVGAADLWWRLHESTIRAPVTTMVDGVVTQTVPGWAEFTRALKKKFVPLWVENGVWERYTKICQGKRTVQEYYDEYMELARYAEDVGAGEARRAHRFYSLLNDDIKDRLGGTIYRDMDHVLGEAITVERQLLASSNPFHGKRKDDRAHSAPSKKSAPLQSTSRPAESQGFSAGRQESRAQSTGNKSTKCKRCHYRHPGKDCKSVIRFNCGRSGHVSTACRFPRQAHQGRSDHSGGGDPRPSAKSSVASTGNQGRSQHQRDTRQTAAPRQGTAAAALPPPPPRQPGQTFAFEEARPTDQAMEDGDKKTLIALQRTELMAAKTVYTDLDFAYNLQLQEALSASSEFPSSSSPPATPPLSPSSAFIADLMLNEIEGYEQEQRDMEQCKLEMRNLNHNLSIQLHDHEFASRIARIPEDDWVKYGDNFEQPYNYNDSASSSSSASREEVFRVYFKGIVVDGDGMSRLAASGVAICDRKDNLVFELSKSVDCVEEGRKMSDEWVELEALVAGLETALALDLKRIEYLCDTYLIYELVSSRRRPAERCVANLIGRVDLLHEKFVQCIPRLVDQTEIKFAFELARASITSQLIKLADHSSEKSAKETCSICYEDKFASIMFSVDGCRHRYCSVCMLRHIESKLLQGGLPRCPFEGCNSGIGIDSCTKLLPPKLLDIMSQRLKESTIPATEKVFCPIPTCSTLMSMSEVKAYSKTAVSRQEELGASRCIKCHVLFCADCKVPWHFKMTCNSYQYFQTNLDNADNKLKSLAKRRKWEECRQCKNMIELAEGCYHITCRCGYEFCYICGAEWKNKKATCQCRLWDERNIIRNHNGRRY